VGLPAALADQCEQLIPARLLPRNRNTNLTCGPPPSLPTQQVPRCTQLRTLRRRQATRQEDKRRAAYRTMLRQQMGS